MLPWLAFSEAAGRAPFVILEHRNFVKKLIFPLEILPVNLAAAGLVAELFALAIFAIGLLVARGGVPLSVRWLPVLLIPQLFLTLGLCWFLAALGRDLVWILLGLRRGSIECCGAVPGTAVRGTSARRSVAGAGRAAGRAAWVFGACGK